MSQDDFIEQLTRPYWSPVHPSKYTIIRQLDRGVTMSTGWGLLFPEDIGAFNLLWLLSGVGGPPHEYNKFGESGLWVAQHANLLLGRSDSRYSQPSLSTAAALLPLAKFSVLVRQQPAVSQVFLRPVISALALRV